jgi:hypothetical protein
MDESLIHDIPKVSPEENAYLTTPYSEYEVRKVVSQTGYKRPCVRWFSNRVFQKSSEIIK